MTARAIVGGVIFKAPRPKTSKAGKPYAIATIREGTGEHVRWWKAFVFNEFAMRRSCASAMATRSRSPASSIASPTKPMPARTA